MSSSSDAHRALNWLRSFLADVAEATQEVDAGLATAGFVSAYRNACMWDRSNSIQSPEQWLPDYVLRVYVEPKYSPKGDALKTPYWGFFQVYLRPPRLSEPTAVWGVVIQAARAELADTWPSATRVGLGRPEPLFVSSTASDWKSADSGALPEEITSLEFMAKPVTELNSAEVIKQVVVGPLSSRLLTAQQSLL
jgi:hypothetical protein